jgi:hypothetical protein
VVETYAIEVVVGAVASAVVVTNICLILPPVCISVYVENY